MGYPDFTDPGVLANPLKAFSFLREHDPVYYVDPYNGWAVCRHDLCLAVMHDQVHFEPDPMRAVIASHSISSALDPDLTYREALLFRGASGGNLMRRFAENLSPEVEVVIRDLVGQPAAGLIDPLHKTVDLHAALIQKLPAEIFIAILGLENHRQATLDWFESVACFYRSSFDRTAILESDRAVAAYLPVLRDCISNSADGARNLLRTAILGDLLESGMDHRDLALGLLQWLGVGLYSTRCAWSTGLHALLSHPDQLRLLKDHPEHLDQAVLECFRFCAPVQTVYRRVVEDTTLDGKLLKKGQIVYLVTAAANRDPRVFELPERFLITRGDLAHAISFASGPRNCPAHRLAAVIAGGVFRAVLQRDLELAGVPEPDRTTLVFHRLNSLPVHFLD